KATKTIPIVMISVGDPVRLGLVESLGHPGKNATGLSFGTLGGEIYAKQIEFLKEAVPKVRRVAILSNPANPGHELMTSSVQGAAQTLGLQILLLEARGPEQFDSAFAEMMRGRVGALLILGDPMLYLYRAQLVDLAAKNRLPSMDGFRESVEAGGLMSYGRNI